MTTSVRSQIAEHFRTEILTGRLAAGEKLPSSQALAVEFSTSPQNAHLALTQLLREGLLTRRPGIGTTVNPVPRQLGQVAVVTFLTRMLGASTFQRTLMSELDATLARHGIRSLALVEDKDAPDWSRLDSLCARGEIQGIVVINWTPELIRRMRSMPVQTVFVATGGRADSAFVSGASMTELAAAELQRLGCRKIGVISSHPLTWDSGKEIPVHRLLRRALAAHGLELRPAWFRAVPAGTHHLRGTEWDADFAFHAFEEIWSAPERPDGFFVFTDDMVPGMLLSVMKQRIDIPEDLKLVVYRNRELPNLCPVPCSFVEFSVRALADALTDLLIRRFHGGAASSCAIDFQVVRNLSGEIK